MGTVIKTQTLTIGGMTCPSCQDRIKRKLLATNGVQKAEVSYTKGTAVISYVEGRVTLRQLISLVDSLGYTAQGPEQRRTPVVMRTVGLLVIIAALYGLLEHFGVLNLLVPSRLAESGMGFGILFVIGLTTSVHCVAMCGGINLSQCMPKTEKTGGGLYALRPAALYNLGRVLSYTVVGLIVGALGSVIVFSAAAQGVLKLLAGVLMVVMGLGMLFPWLGRFTPRMPKRFTRNIQKEKPGRGPLFFGLLNGLMPCGPLQAMQLYALSTGSPWAGALSMLLFSLGTVPVMFGFGALSSALGRRFARKALTAGAVLVAVMGLTMLSQGISLSGQSAGPGPEASIPDGAGAVIDDPIKDDEFQLIDSTLSPRKYPNITVRAGIPVKWVIDAPQGSINGCNNRMFVGAYGIEHSFTVGENVIEFTPDKAGTFRYSCWMGMIHGTIRVTDGSE